MSKCLYKQNGGRSKKRYKGTNRKGKKKNASSRKKDKTGGIILSPEFKERITQGTMNPFGYQTNKQIAIKNNEIAKKKEENQQKDIEFKKNHEEVEGIDLLNNLDKYSQYEFYKILLPGDAEKDRARDRKKKFVTSPIGPEDQRIFQGGGEEYSWEAKYLGRPQKNTDPRSFDHSPFTESKELSESSDIEETYIIFLDTKTGKKTEAVALSIVTEKQPKIGLLSEIEGKYDRLDDRAKDLYDNEARPVTFENIKYKFYYKKNDSTGGRKSMRKTKNAKRNKRSKKKSKRKINFNR